MVLSILLTLASLTSLTSYVAADFIRFDVISSPQAVILGQDLVLNCRAVFVHEDNSNVNKDDHLTPLFYQWIFDGSPIDPSVRSASVFGNHSLFLSVISRNELGVYNCRVSTADDDISATSDAISVAEAYIESFEVVPTGAIVNEGEGVDFSCVTGWSAPPAVVTWVKDGRPFLGDQQTSARFGESGAGGAIRLSANLHFDRALPEFSGEYFCAAFNSMNNEEVVSSSAVLTVLAEDRAPYSIGDLPSNLLLPEGQPYVLECPILGWPLPDLLWYKAGVEVVTDQHVIVHSNGTLAFSPVLRDHTGVYVCVGSNVFDSTALDPVNVSVAYLDYQFAVTPSPLTSAVAGQSLTLECVPPESHPAASTMWYKDGAPVIMRGGEFGIVPNDDGHLVFKNVQEDDSGEYLCVAENSLAVPKYRSSSVAVVSVTASATLVEPPLQQRILKGALLSLHCGALGNPLPEVTWYLDDHKVTASSRISLVDRGQDLIIDDVNKLDEGYYSCAASNMYGTAESAAILVFIIVPPQLIQPMKNVAASKGSSVLLQCSFYADPEATVTWVKDGREFNLDTDKYSAEDEGLRIASLVASDQGEYTCTGSNEGGQAQSGAKLIVQDSPLITSLPPQITLIALETLRLHCDATGSPLPHVVWLFNGTASFPSNVIFSSDNRSLRVYSVAVEHTGAYTCRAENILGVNTKSVDVLVQTRPEVVSIVGDLLIAKGEELQLKCNVDGIPAPFIFFYKDGVPLESTADRRIEALADGSLRVRFVTEADGGVYACRATNVAGEEEKVVRVSIQGDPLPPVLLNTIPMSQHSVNITWRPTTQVSGTVAERFLLRYKLFHLLTWLELDKEIPSNPSWYEVDTLSPAAHYVFKMAAVSDIKRIGEFSNILGATTFASAPSQPRFLLAKDITSNGVLLAWSSPANTNGQIALYQLNYKEKYDGEQHIEEVHPSDSTLQASHYVGDLSPYMTYECKVRAGNVQNASTLWGEYSKALSFTTAMAVPSASPTTFHALNVSSTQVTLSWTPIKAKDQNGVVKRYRIQYKTKAASGFDSVAIPANMSTAVVKDLLPWQQYTFRISGWNSAGYGPFEALSLKTLADVPSKEPINVQARPLSSRSIEVRWQSVAIDGQNSDISGYIVLYRPQYESDSISVYHATPTRTRLNISDLLPWTVYKVKVQAYTTQVHKGFGPFSPEVSVTTEEETPGKITNLTIVAKVTSALLSWSRPLNPNGEILRYKIVYAVMIDPHASHRRKRHTTKSSQLHTEADDTQFVVRNLEPHSEYYVGVSAVNSIGSGVMENATFETLQESTEMTTSPSTLSSAFPTLAATANAEIFTDIGANGIVKEVEAPSSRSGLSTGKVVGLVIGVTMMAVLLTVIIILLTYCCIRRRKQSLMQSEIPSGATYRTTDNKLNTAPVQRPPPEGSVISSSTAQSSATSTSDNTHYSSHPTTDRHHRNIPPTNDAHTGPTPQNGARSKRDLEDMYRERDGFGISNNKHNVHGIDNPAYDGWLSDFGNPYSTVQDLPPELRVSTRTNQRMRSDMAAAIASQKNRETSVFADNVPATQPESFVVYRERTAL